jgi:hypothetical protein
MKLLGGWYVMTACRYFYTPAVLGLAAGIRNEEI